MPSTAIQKKNARFLGSAAGRKNCLVHSRRPIRLVVLSDLHNSEFGAYNSELVDKGFYLRIPVGHVEAGLRTCDLDSPYPEEFNRQAVGVLAKYNFAPTEQAKQNLLRKWFSWWAAPRTFPAWHTA